MRHKLSEFAYSLLLMFPMRLNVPQALAQPCPDGSTRIGGICVGSGPPAGTKVNPVTIIDTTINWAFGLLIILASAFIVYAAFVFLTSSGDTEKVKQAKNLILYAVIAIAVAFFARAVVYIVRELLRAGFTG